ncbi:MAG: 4'-phosphopantetheinyl transferase superfamily protein [Flavobacteriales bacterium]|nr:4'-phosphopantetheinyl transferase superfamily protein [Flavobacteriales bacterium]
MIELTLIDLPERLNEMQWNASLHFLPDPMKEKVSRYRRWQDQQSNLIGKLLILSGLYKRGFGLDSLSRLKFTDFDKPYLNDKIHFNISHSGSVIFSGFSTEGPIGVDVEEKNPVNILEFDGIFSDLEWSILTSEDTPEDTFYRFWTTKESVIKAVGKGLSLVLKEVMVIRPDVCTYKGINYNIRLPELKDGYAFAFATTCNQDFAINRFTMDQLLNTLDHGF